jgi:hypothetical protein
MRDEGRIADEALRELEHELDLSEARLAAAISHQITLFAHSPIEHTRTDT